MKASTRSQPHPRPTGASPHHAQIRRATFRLDVEVALAALQPWIIEAGRVAVLSPSGYVELFARSAQLRLGGNIHDAVIGRASCRERV